MQILKLVLLTYCLFVHHGSQIDHAPIQGQRHSAFNWTKFLFNQDSTFRRNFCFVIHSV